MCARAFPARCSASSAWCVSVGRARSKGHDACGPARSRSAQLARQALQRHPPRSRAPARLRQRQLHFLQRPDAVRAAEVGDARRSADARARVHHHALGARTRRARARQRRGACCHVSMCVREASLTGRRRGHVPRRAVRAAARLGLAKQADELHHLRAAGRVACARRAASEATPRRGCRRCRCRTRVQVLRVAQAAAHVVSPRQTFRITQRARHGSGPRGTRGEEGRSRTWRTCGARMRFHALSSDASRPLSRRASCAGDDDDDGTQSIGQRGQA